MSNPNSRQRIRRVYGYQRTQPQTIVLTDNTGNSRTLPAGSLLLHRDFFIVNAPSGSSGLIPSDYAEYDEDLILFNWQDEATDTFNITFTGNPIVVLSMETTALGLENVQPYILSYNTSGLTIGVSALYSGSVRYRAIYSPTYPCVVQRNILEPGLYYNASAGTINPAGASNFSSAYTPLQIGPPTSFFMSSYGSGGQADLNIVSSSYDLTTVQGELSSHFNESINYLAVE